jgi:hypothetical protein
VFINSKLSCNGIETFVNSNKNTRPLPVCKTSDFYSVCYMFVYNVSPLEAPKRQGYHERIMEILHSSAVVRFIDNFVSVPRQVLSELQHISFKNENTKFKKSLELHIFMPYLLIKYAHVLAYRI